MLAPPSVLPSLAQPTSNFAARSEEFLPAAELPVLPASPGHKRESLSHIARSTRMTFNKSNCQKIHIKHLKISFGILEEYQLI